VTWVTREKLKKLYTGTFSPTAYTGISRFVTAQLIDAAVALIHNQRLTVGS